MQGLEKKEGIVLRSVDFKERQRILTVITQEAGLIQLIVKNLTRKKPDLLLLTSPFCLGEFVYFKGRSDIFRCDEGKVLKEYYSEQKDWAHMQALGHLAKAVLYSQLPGKPAPLLFSLLKTYLEKLSSIPDSHSLCVSFYLKTLKHEGLLVLETQCCSCHKENAQCLFDGQSYCLKDAPAQSSMFTKEEWKKLLTLSEVRSFQDLASLAENPTLLEKVSQYFSRKMKES